MIFKRHLLTLSLVLSGPSKLNGFTPTTPLTTQRIGQKSYIEKQQPRNSEVLVKHEKADTQLNVWSPFTKDKEVAQEIEEEVQEASPGPLDTKNAIAGATWVALITWAFLFAPGSVGSDADNDMVNTLITQPVPRPSEINELWFAVWNTFAIIPAFLAALAAPTGRGQRLPAAPFLWGSAAFGFMSLGPYFATRTDRSNEEGFMIRKDDLGWASKNIFENRIFGIILSAIAISIPFSSDIFVSGFDWGAKIAEYRELFQSSRFIAVASTDVTIMSVLGAVLVSEDCKLRGEGWNDKSIPLFIGTLLLPVLGPCLYLAARPSLEE